MDLLITLIIAAGLGFIPAEIAKKKGRDKYWLWWFYGWMIFVVALIHSLCMKDYNSGENNVSNRAVPITGTADEIKRYKELLDCGAITSEEFEAKKTQLLNINF